MNKGKGLEGLFDGRHFDREIIVLCVRWYLRYKLSLRDLVEMMAEPGLSLAHTTIMRWVKRFTPEFVKRWNRFGIPTGRPDGGLHAQGKARRGCGKSLFQQRSPASGPATGDDHARWVCGLAPGREGDDC